MLPIVWAWDARADLVNFLDILGTAILPPHTVCRTLFRRPSKGWRSSPWRGASEGFLGRVLGTREIVAHPNYVIVYRVEIDRVRVINVLHARQHYR